MIHVNSFHRNKVKQTGKQQQINKFQCTRSFWKHLQSPQKSLKRSQSPNIDLQALMTSNSKKQCHQFSQTKSIFLVKGNLLPYLEKQKHRTFDERDTGDLEANKISQFYVSNYQNWNSRDKTFYPSKIGLKNDSRQASQNPKTLQPKYSQKKKKGHIAYYQNNTDNQVPLSKSFARALSVFRKKQNETRIKENTITELDNSFRKRESLSYDFKNAGGLTLTPLEIECKQKSEKQVIKGNRTIIHEKPKPSPKLESYVKFGPDHLRKLKQRKAKINHLMGQNDRYLTPWNNDFEEQRF